MMLRKAGSVLLCLALVGCASYSLVEARRTTIDGVYSIEPQIAWNKTTASGDEIWTVDGPQLDALRFISGVENGQALFEVKDDKDMPKFRAGMSPSEIVELVVDSMTLLGASSVEPANARPAKFGRADGVRFELTFVSSTGMEQDGMVVGAVIEDELYVIMYTAVRMHYFPAYRDHVDRLIASIELA